jgi:hypothetical protein
MVPALCCSSRAGNFSLSTRYLRGEEMRQGCPQALSLPMGSLHSGRIQLEHRAGAAALFEMLRRSCGGRRALCDIQLS